MDFLGHCRMQRSLLGLNAAPFPCKILNGKIAVPEQLGEIT